MRIHTYSRNLNSRLLDRARIASMIDRAPVLVEVKRYPPGGGVTSGKTLQPVGSFIARLDEMRRMPQTVSNDAYAVTPITLLLIALIGNDAVDGSSGNPVDIKTNDRVTVKNGNTVIGTYIVAGINPTQSHYEIALQERA